MGFVFVLFGISIVAGATCHDDETIMRLYSNDNSHVSVWNQNVGAYLEEICYDDIYGVKYGGSNPHVCDGSNRVLSLYDSVNSHASDTSDADYNQDVCFGDLVCEYDSSAGGACNNSGEVVARMYSNSNSHVGGPSSGYPIKVCCVSAESKVSPAYWADANGNKITEADFGDTVHLVVKWTSSGTFNIMEDDGVLLDILDDEIITDIEGTSVGSSWVGSWVIKEEDLDKTSDYDEFYFTINGERSEHLKINLLGNNAPIEISILSPGCGNDFDQGENITITVSANDPDDIIFGKIMVNGNNYSFTNGGISINKVLDVPGNLGIIAEASNGRDGKSRAISNIMVLGKSGAVYDDGDYVAACINKPKNFEHILEDVVDFDASGTRGVKAVGGVLQYFVPGQDPFDWYWTFNPQNIQRNFLDSSEVLAYRFTAEFPVPGENSASLRVEL